MKMMRLTGGSSPAGTEDVMATVDAGAKHATVTMLSCAVRGHKTEEQEKE